MIGLEVRIECKRYAGADRAALRDVAFSAAPGEFVAILGPSGAGKSTLLKIVSGLDKDFAGSVVMRRADGREETARNAFMFQEPRLMPWLTALDNVRLVLGRDPAAAEFARQLLHDVELADALNVFPLQLSGGMQRRVALARAFAVRPALLFMDEPFVSLDAPTAARLRRLLEGFWDRSRPTVLFVTHDLPEALMLADRIIFLSGPPGGVLLDMPIELPRPRGLEDGAVDALQSRLLADHPGLLAGHRCAAVANGVEAWR